MVKIRKVSAALLEQRQTATRAQSAREVARQKREAPIRDLLTQLSSPDQAFLVTPGDGEKASTVRTSLLKVAKELGRQQDIVVRKHEDGFLVGLSTPDRQATRRGRRPNAP